MNEKRRDDDDDQYTLIIQAAENKTQNSSLLFQEWDWPNDIAYASVSPSSIDSTCFVVSMSENSSTILETVHHEKWAEKFTEDFSTEE